MSEDKKEHKAEFKGEFTSRVFKSAENWYDIGLLVPHETLRMAQNDMLDVTQPQHFNVDKHPWKYQQFFRWFNEYFYTFIHHHHHNEEAIYIPWMKTKVKDFPPKITADHKQLIELLDVVKGTEKEFVSAGTDGQKLLAAAELLRQRLNDLFNHTNDHLEEEERIVPPLLKQHFTEAEEQTPIQQIVKGNGFDGNRKELPWIIHAMERWGGEKFIQERFWKKVPGIVKTFYYKYWKDEYEKTNRNMIQSIKLDAKPRDPVQHCCCCCRYFM